MSKKLIRFDWAIKRLLRNKANFAVLEGFLSEVLFDEIRIRNIIESESNQEDENDKYNRVDILTENSKNELIIVEIQNSYEIDFFHRMNFGVSKSIVENLGLGQKYSEIKKVISINIVYFDLGQGEDYVYKGKTDFIGIHRNDLLGLSTKQKITFSKENVSDIFPEFYILKVNQFDGVAKDTLDEWIYFLKNSEVKEEFKAKGLKEAEQVLDIMKLNKEQKYIYDRHLDSLHLKASEIFSLQTEAEFKVRGDEKTEIAIKAIENGADNKFISLITELSIEKVQELRIELKK